MSLSKCKIIDLPEVTNPKGNLTFIEGINHIPFEIKRVYYVYNTPEGMNRGGHAHKNLHQLIVAISGSFDVILDDGKERKNYHLDKPNTGLYTPPMIWHEFNNFSIGAICLVFVSDIFSKELTIDSYSFFKDLLQE